MASAGAAPRDGPKEATLDARPANGAESAVRQHHRALEQLEAVERALHAHLAVPGTPLKLGLNTALGRLPFVGAFACHSLAAVAGSAL
jgi:hypothetical protein